MAPRPCGPNGQRERDFRSTNLSYQERDSCRRRRAPFLWSLALVVPIDSVTAWTPLQATRRDCLTQWGSAATAKITGRWNYGATERLGGFGTLVAVVADDDDTPEQRLQRDCADQALAIEQAIPGAYQQACMTLPIRQIPLRVVVPREAGFDAAHGPASFKEYVHVLEIEQAYTGTNTKSTGSLSGSTGTVIWNSSLLLTRLLERLANSDSIALFQTNRNPLSPLQPVATVMELGCGTGLVSLAAARLGATRVWATDGNPTVVQLATANIQRNHATSQVSAVHLPWGLLSAMDYSESADLVVGSDLTYFSGNWPALAATMSTVVKPRGMILYLSLGHAGFNVQAELDGFLSVASGFGLVPATVGPVWTERALTSMLLNECLTSDEVDMIQSNGGVRVVALQSRR